MRKVALLLALVALAWAHCHPAFHQGPPWMRAQTVTVSGTVESINYDLRYFVLKTNDGRVVQVKVPMNLYCNGVPALDAIKVGEEVTVKGYLMPMGVIRAIELTCGSTVSQVQRPTNVTAVPQGSGPFPRMPGGPMGGPPSGRPMGRGVMINATANSIAAKGVKPGPICLTCHVQVPRANFVHEKLPPVTFKGIIIKKAWIPNRPIGVLVIMRTDDGRQIYHAIVRQGVVDIDALPEGKELTFTVQPVMYANNTKLGQWFMGPLIYVSAR